MYVINFTIFVCGISEDFVCLLRPIRSEAVSEATMEWRRTHQIVWFTAIPFENRLLCLFLAIPCHSSPVLAIPLNHNAPPQDKQRYMNHTAHASTQIAEQIFSS